MRVPLRLLVLALACAASAPVLADAKTDFAMIHAVAQAPTNRIVGVWDARVDVGPCTGTGPRRQFRGLNVYNLGGTLVDTNAFAPTSRGPGFGTWYYDRRDEVYRSRMQFFRYLPDGTFDGVQDIVRETVLSADGTRTVDEVFVRVLNPDDTLRLEMCGTATATLVDPL